MGPVVGGPIKIQAINIQVGIFYAVSLADQSEQFNVKYDLNFNTYRLTSTSHPTTQSDVSHCFPS
jgi:hypothetical protein